VAAAAAVVVAAGAVLARSGMQLRGDMTTVDPAQVFHEKRAFAIVPIGCELPVGETLPAAIERIVHELMPEKVVLFGSFAYGSPTADSDVDLLVILETSQSSKDRSWAVSRLLLPRPFPVDIIVKTPQEIALALARGDSFVREILEHGMVLYERRN
jgi:predicted nucleotidyltransferase